METLQNGNGLNMASIWAYIYMFNILLGVLISTVTGFMKQNRHLSPKPKIRTPDFDPCWVGCGPRDWVCRELEDLPTTSSNEF